MSTTKDEDDTLLNVPSTASVIKEEELIVVDEYKYIIKDDDIKVKAGSIKDSNTVMEWDVSQILNGVGIVILFAGGSIYSLGFDIFFLMDFLFVE